MFNLNILNIKGIKEANINISPITVIAGENSKNKSVISKLLMSLIKADNIARHYKVNINSSTDFQTNRLKNLNRQIELLFKNSIAKDGSLSLYSKNNKENIVYDIKIKENKCVKFDGIDHFKNRNFLDCTIIKTPVVWDVYDFFTSIYSFKKDVRYPYILWDLYLKLSKSRPNCDPNKNTINKIKSIIGGSFTKDKKNEYFFVKRGNSFKIPLENVTLGIKSFGTIQILLENCYINKNALSIFEEPESHLHPKWQIKFGEVISEITKRGVTIIINTESPYIIEGIEKYSKENEVETSFYLDKGETVVKEEPTNIVNILKDF